MATNSRKPLEWKRLDMAQRVHSVEDEAVAVEAVDPATLLAENQSLRDRLQRALADAENTRRRAERSLDEMRQYATTNFAREMLSVEDNLRRAIDSAERNPVKSVEDAALLEGVRSTERMLMQALARFGVQTIEAAGAPFDPALHEAVLEVDDPERQPGTVAEVLEDGYTIHGRLLRPARVAVVKRRTEAAPADNAEAHRNHQP
jgi:molecular chaperone GrpE